MGDDTSGSDYRDRLVEEVTAQVTRRHAIEQEEAVVRERAERAVDGLIDAPVQGFVPLLAENEVVTSLREDERPTQQA